MGSVRCISCMREMEGPTCPHCGYPADKQNLEHQLPVGSVLQERYQIGKVLGQGGFGITYLAWDLVSQSPVAIKEFFPKGVVIRDSTTSAEVRCGTRNMVPHYEYSKDRFLREANVLARFKDNPVIVGIKGFAEENNTAYIVMEYVKGVDLAKYIQRKGGKLTADETFRILKPIMTALAEIHKAGIIHRDISPDNIILDPMGGAKLLDFGAVRSVENPHVEKALTKSTEAILKHGFAPMEQYNTRGSLGPWTDEYAMCATIWYCLTGNIPEEATIRMTEGIDWDWSSIPELTSRQQMVLEKGSACRSKDRFPDMDTFIDELFSPISVLAFEKERDMINRSDNMPVVQERKHITKTIEKQTKRCEDERKKSVSTRRIFVVAVAVAIVLFSVVIGVIWGTKGKQPETIVSETLSQEPVEPASTDSTAPLVLRFQRNIGILTKPSAKDIGILQLVNLMVR